MADQALTDEQLRALLQEYLTILHTWRARHTDDRWRVDAQFVERFEDLNENASRLFATPEEGLNR